MIEARSSALVSSRTIRTSGRALIWQGTEPKDLNAFVRDPGPFVQLTGAFSINDAGEIVCQGVTNTGELHACLAIPRDEDEDDSGHHGHGHDHHD